MEPQQFNSLIAQYKGLVVTVCFSVTKNYFDAEDLAQETFFAAYRNLNRFDGRNPKGWLTAIAVNKCRDFLRSPASRYLPLSDEEAALLTDGSKTPEEYAEQKDSALSVKQFCGRLKEPYRSVAEAYFCNSQTLSQMAQETGLNLRTLETQLYRAKKMLRALWKEEQEIEVHSRNRSSS